MSAETPPARLSYVAPGDPMMVVLQTLPRNEQTVPAQNPPNLQETPLNITMTDMGLDDIVYREGETIRIKDPVLFDEILNLYIRVKFSETPSVKSSDDLHPEMKERERNALMKRLVDPANTRIMLARGIDNRLIGAYEYVVRTYGPELTARTPVCFAQILKDSGLPDIPKGAKLLQLNYAYLDPDYQKHGIGKTSMKEMIKMHRPYYILFWTRSPAPIKAAMNAIEEEVENDYRIYIAGMPLGAYPPNNIIYALLNAGSSGIDKTHIPLFKGTIINETRGLQLIAHHLVELDLPIVPIRWDPALANALLVLMSSYTYETYRRLQGLGIPSINRNGELFPVILINTSLIHNFDEYNIGTDPNFVLSLILDLSKIEAIRDVIIDYLVEGAYAGDPEKSKIRGLLRHPFRLPSWNSGGIEILDAALKTSDNDAIQRAIADLSIAIPWEAPKDQQLTEILEKLQRFDPYSYKIAFPMITRSVSELIKIYRDEKCTKYSFLDYLILLTFSNYLLAAQNLKREEGGDL